MAHRGSLSVQEIGIDFYMYIDLSNKDLILQNVEWFLSVYLLYVDIEIQLNSIFKLKFSSVKFQKNKF